IENRKPTPIALTHGFPDLNIKDLLHQTKVEISVADLLQHAPNLRHECTRLFKRANEAYEQEVHRLESDQPEPESYCSLKMNVMVKGEPFTAVIDTGAACSVVSRGFVEHVKEVIHPVETRLLQTADGSKHQPIGVVEDLPVQIRGALHPANFSVIDRPDKLLILGMNWLRTYKATVDLDKNRLWLPRRNQPGNYYEIHVQDKNRSHDDEVLSVLETETSQFIDPHKFLKKQDHNFDNYRETIADDSDHDMDIETKREENDPPQIPPDLHPWIKPFSKEDLL
ncbi:cyanamide hydratase, partial [Podila clonocystis]